MFFHFYIRPYSYVHTCTWQNKVKKSAFFFYFRRNYIYHYFIIELYSFKFYTSKWKGINVRKKERERETSASFYYLKFILIVLASQNHMHSLSKFLENFRCNYFLCFCKYINIFEQSLTYALSWDFHLFEKKKCMAFIIMLWLILALMHHKSYSPKPILGKKKRQRVKKEQTRDCCFILFARKAKSSLLNLRDSYSVKFLMSSFEKT